MNFPLVNLHIVGVQKAGTSALAHFLSQHPDVCVVEGKEAHVFDQPDFLLQDEAVFANRRYSKKLCHYSNEKIICDATPITIFNSDFLKSCYEYNAQAKFIVLLRDPVERAVSHFYMSKERGREKSNMITSFMQENKRLKRVPDNERWLSGSVWRDNTYLKRGDYKTQLASLKKIIPQSQCLILHQETLLKEHDKTLQQVFDFLNLQHCSIARKKVFSSTIDARDKTEWIARAYARLYFFLNGVYPYRAR